MKACRGEGPEAKFKNSFKKIFFGGIFNFFVLYSTLLHLPLSDSAVPTDAGIEPRTVATGALTVRLDLIRNS